MSSNSLRSKLVQVGERFLNFDKQIESDVLRKKGEYLDHFTQISREIEELENRLEIENSERQKGINYIKNQTESRANEMLNTINVKLTKSLNKISITLESLLSRIDVIEMGICQFRGDTPSKALVDVEILNEEVLKMFEKISDLSESISISINVVESSLLKLHDDFLSICADEDEIFREKYSAIRHNFHSFFSEDKKSQIDSDIEKFKQFITAEIEDLRLSIDKEKNDREAADEEIIQCIDLYSDKLKNAMRCI